MHRAKVGDLAPNTGGWHLGLSAGTRKKKVVLGIIKHN